MTDRAGRIRTRFDLSAETRRHLRIMAAEGDISMSRALEQLIDVEWQEEHTPDLYRVRKIRSHADERHDMVMKWHREGKSVAWIWSALPEHLHATTAVIEAIIKEADHD
ncbi:hypothetical protein [Bifidobacterium aquikefiricola]|uniref:Antitoxin n=1 Tax=Bifidobacterium aquikefiricola TaxID=3059038 RepID=A0AB39U7H8_9BIFI